MNKIRALKIVFKCENKTLGFDVKNSSMYCSGGLRCGDCAIQKYCNTDGTFRFSEEELKYFKIKYPEEFI